MTTIAWDGRYLAADGWVMTGGEEPMVLQDDYAKITSREVTVGGGWLRRGKRQMRAVAGAGAAGAVDRFAEWFFAGGKGDRPEVPENDDGGFHVLTLTADIDDGPLGGVSVDVLCEEWDEHYRYVIDRPLAIGVGKRYAMASMLAGATAVQALGITVQLDAWTGGVVRHLDTHRWWKGVQP